MFRCCYILRIYYHQYPGAATAVVHCTYIQQNKVAFVIYTSSKYYYAVLVRQTSPPEPAPCTSFDWEFSEEHQATPGLLVRVCIFSPEPPCDAYRGALQSSSRTSNSNSTKSTNSITLRQCSADVLDTEGKAYVHKAGDHTACRRETERTACRRERGNPPAILVSCVLIGGRDKNGYATMKMGYPKHTHFVFSETEQNRTKRNETASRQGSKADYSYVCCTARESKQQASLIPNATTLRYRSNRNNATWSVIYTLQQTTGCCAGIFGDRGIHTVPPSSPLYCCSPRDKGGKKRKTGKTGQGSTAVYCWKIFARGARDLNLGVHFRFLAMK